MAALNLIRFLQNCVRRAPPDISSFSFAIFLHCAAALIKKKVVWKEQFCSQFSVAGDKQVIFEPLDFTSKTAANTSTLARVQL